MLQTKKTIVILTVSFLFCYIFHTTAHSQALKGSSSFPMEFGNQWTLLSPPDTLVETIVDTQRIGDNVYFLFDQFRELPGYQFRIFEDKVYIYADTAEYLWYNFSADSGESWIAPPLGHPYYGGTFTMQSKVDTIVNPAGTFTDCQRIHHFIGADFEFVEWFADGIGIVQRDVITFAGLRRWVLIESVTSVFNDNELANEKTYLLSQNYPNPFNPVTKINYSIPQSSQVVIKIFDILGNEIEELVNEIKPKGTYELRWYVENLPSGIYFYRLKAGDFIETKKMVLMK